MASSSKRRISGSSAEFRITSTGAEMGTTQRMARFITEARFEDIPTPAVNLAKLCLLDAAGCAIYGATRPLGKIFTSLVDELGGKPVARVVGTSIATNAVNAAMANATL